MDRGAWRATVQGVAKSQTRLSTHMCLTRNDAHVVKLQEKGWM